MAEARRAAQQRLARAAGHVVATAEAAASVTLQEDVVEAVMAPVRLGGPRVSHGRGIFVWDQDGNKYIDGSGGPAGVFALGHAHPEVTQAAKDQMDQSESPEPASRDQHSAPTRCQS
jgi:acetylornithine/succinyldiaminopimelate/putrescine aminotransferase